MTRVRMCGVVLAVSAVLLGLFGSGYALRCFSCTTMGNKVCTANMTCSSTDDACLLIKSGDSRLTSCYPYNTCNADALAKKFNLGSFTFNCCQIDLCNSSGMTVANKAIFSLVTMLALAWICF